METKIKVLILEHDQNDVGLLAYELKSSGLPFETVVVQDKQDYEQALRYFLPDIILSDYSFPAFDGLTAFHIKQQVLPESPFIIVSGTIGEENAVNLIKMGVTDYVLKEKMYQVMPKIQRALKEVAERKQKQEAERQLRQREEQLQKILNLSKDVICTLNQQAYFVSVSAASEEVWGYAPQELIGTCSFDLVHPEDKAKTSQALAGLQQGRDLVNFENRFICKNRGVVTLFWSAHWDPEEQQSYCVARNATDIKQAEEKIKNNEKRFRTLLQNSSDGFSLVAADGTVLERSPSVLRFLGLETGATAEKIRLDLLHPEDRCQVEEIFKKVKENPDKIVSCECRIKTNRGEYNWLEATWHNQLQEPAVAAIVINYRDITERKLAEIALSKREKDYRRLFNLSPTPMWVYDVETLYFLDINQAAIRHYGYSREEFLSMTLHDIRPSAEIGKLEKIAAQLKEDKMYYHEVFRHMKKNGEIIDVEISSNLVNLDGRNARVVLAIDVSERMRYLEAIQKQNVALREIAWIQSHVVRAPLARMMGLISLLTYTPDKVSGNDLISLIASSAYELDGIIRNIVRKAEQVEDTLLLEEQLEQKEQLEQE